VGIWFRPGLKFKIISTDRDNEGRLICVVVTINGQTVKLVNIYAPIIQRERKLFFESLKYFLQGKYPMILGGDFNCVTNINKDKCGGNYLKGNTASDKLIQICEDNQLIDIFRKLYPKKKEYTWRNTLHTIFCRLDRIYISKSLSNNVSYVKHEPISETVSDHDLVVMEIALGEVFNQGPGYWKCNNSILKDPYFLEDFKMLWETLDSIPDQTTEWWEKCKQEFRQLIICHSMRLSRIGQLELKEAKRALIKLTRHEESNGTTPELQYQIRQAQSVIDKLNDSYLEGAKIRSKVKWLETNEKPTRFFLQKEKKSATDKVITSLLTEEGNLITNSSDIKEECTKYYEQLYNQKRIDNSLYEYFLEDIPTLSQESSEHCEGEITVEECKRALKEMENNKSPGPDGLSKEFYTIAFPYIGTSFVQLLNRVWSEGKLPYSQRQCFITLICKNKDNKDQLSNWRPISLLNCDYKILSKILSLRLRTVLDGIVHPDQTCSIPGRTIQDNVHLIRNLIEYVNAKNIPAAIISLDQSKAFDRVSHEYLFQVLHSFGFGPQFISLVKLLYTEIYSSVLVNGFVCREFSVKCSVRQGCSLSPLLYVLCIEPFANKIRNDPMIRGIPLPGATEDCKISQYADDTNIFVTDLKSVRKILILVELFEFASAAKLNKQKSVGMWLGKWRGRVDQPVGLQWTSESIKFYGVYIGTVAGNIKTWQNVLTKFEKCVNLYSRRDLSLRGRSTILNVVLCSSIWYVGSLISMPEIVLKKINKLVFKFLWNNKPELIKRETLLNDYQQGGLKVVDIKSKIESFRVRQVLQLIKGNKAKWKYYAVYWIGLQLRKYVLSFASLSIPHAEQIPDYYENAIRLFRIFEALAPDFMSRQSVTTKFIYANFVKARIIEPRVIKIYRNVNFIQSWKWIHSGFVDPRYRDLAWRIAHQILPTQSLLYKYNITKNAKCYLCKHQIETMSHLFYECRILNGLWRFVESTLVQLTGCQVRITLNAIQFNTFKLQVSNINNELQVLLVNTLKYCIWTMRNLCKHEFKKVMTQDIKAFFIHTLTMRIKADFQRFDSLTFSRYWCNNNNSITRVEGNSIKILLRLHPP
jgi:hypothetical protein